MRSSFRDKISKVKRHFQYNENSSRENIRLIKYDSIDNVFIHNRKYSSKRLSHCKYNENLLITRHTG